MAAFNGLEDVLWDLVPDALNVDPQGWWTMVPTVLGGICVGLILRFAPGHGGPSPAEGHAVGGEGGAGVVAIPGLLLAAIITLACGASLGPEMPLMAAVVTIGGLSAVALRLPSGMTPGLALAGIASLFGGIFGSPLLGAVFVIELAGEREKGPDGQPGPSIYSVLIPALIGSAVGSLVFLAIFGEAFAAYKLPQLDTLEAVDALWALGIGAGGALLGMAFIHLFRAVDAVAQRVGNPVLLATLGGALVGAIALVFGHRTLFSGEHELQDVIDASDGAGVLLALILGKLLALTISLATGFRGGRIFPLLFIGGVLGLALADVTSVPSAVSVPCGMVATAIPAMRMPLLMIVIVGFFTGAQTLPLLVLAGVVSYLLCQDQPDLRDPPVVAQTAGRTPPAAPA